jgi:hypothetical protein
MRRHPGCTIITLLLAVLVPLGAAAQPLSTADLAGEWFFSQVTAPTTTFTGPSIRSYRGTVLVDALGAASGTLVDDLAASFTVTGTLALAADGVLGGTLTLSGPDTRTLDVREGRMLADRHSIVGAATLTRASGAPTTSTGLFTLVRLTDQTFSRQADLVGDWHYHEINPSNTVLGGDADWSRGTVTFHTNGCSTAELVFSDGTVREALDTSDPPNLTSFG